MPQALKRNLRMEERGATQAQVLKSGVTLAQAVTKDEPRRSIAQVRYRNGVTRDIEPGEGCVRCGRPGAESISRRMSGGKHHIMCADGGCQVPRGESGTVDENGLPVMKDEVASKPECPQVQVHRSGVNPVQEGSQEESMVPESRAKEKEARVLSQGLRSEDRVHTKEPGEGCYQCGRIASAPRLDPQAVVDMFVLARRNRGGKKKKQSPQGKIKNRSKSSQDYGRLET